MSLTFFLMTVLVALGNCEWDLAVLTSNSLDLLGHAMSQVSSTPLGITNISSLVYDPLYLHHYFSATGHPNASIFRVQVSRDGRVGPIEPIIKKQPGRVFSLAYDAESTTVFWTSSKQILRSQLDIGLTEGQVIHSFENSQERPLSITVEPCSRFIYWSYRSQFIDRSLMDGSHKERIVEGLFIPVAITISQAERKIYWVDEGPGYSFRIGRALLDGSNKETIFESLNQQPSSLVVMPNPTQGSIVYWTDIMSKNLWSLKENSSEPESVKEYDRPIYAVASADSFKKLDKHVCSHLINMRDQVPYAAISPTVGACVHGTFSGMSGSCICNPGYIGTLCETSICFNYCLNGGTCSMPDGKPYCRCPPETSGKRCEIHSCQGFCQKGECNTSSEGRPSCTCEKGWYGTKCNLSEEFCAFTCSHSSYQQDGCNCNATLSAPSALVSSDYKDKFLYTAIASGVLAVLLLVLIVNTLRLGRRRPRVRKTYKVTPHKGSAPQPVRTSPDCQIAIENCCNMNICETPCYEPELRPPGGRNKKEEKRGLLREMEVQPESGKTF